MQNTVHFVLQAKGGIGKSFVSTLLAQHVIHETGSVRCFDTDQENTTFEHYAALCVRHIPLGDQSRVINPKRFDTLMETLLTEEGNAGSNSDCMAVQRRLNSATMLSRVIQTPSCGCVGLESDRLSRRASKGAAAIQAMETMSGMS